MKINKERIDMNVGNYMTDSAFYSFILIRGTKELLPSIYPSIFNAGSFLSGQSRGGREFQSLGGERKIFSRKA